MNELVGVENMIFEVRGKQVIMDSDLAKLYECKNGTKSINLAVKRHLNRFPERYMFQLTREEYDNLRFQFETLNKNNQRQGLNLKYLPYVFTEEGVAMLSAVLKTPVAEQMSIKIMDAFVAMRKYISNNLLTLSNYSNMLIDHEERIKLLENTFSKFDTFSNNCFSKDKYMMHILYY